MALPSITATGGLIADPELRFLPDGKPMCTGRIACNERKRDASGNWVDGDPTFIDFVVFGKPGENLVESCSRGDQVLVHGVLQQREWEKDGEKRTAYSIRADTVAVSVLFRPAKPAPKEPAKDDPPW